MKKLVKVVAVMLATVFVFAGCSKKEATTASTSSKGGESFKIGGVFPLSGDVAVYGVECKNGIDLAIEEINAAGGIGGKQIVLISEDDRGNPADSVNAFRKLTTRDGVDIVIGSLTSGCTIAMTTLAQAEKKLQIAPAATAEAVTDAGNYIFRACFIDPFQGTVGGIFAAQNLNTKRAAVLYDVGNDYSVGLTENFVAAFTSNGGEVVAQESYSTGDRDFNAQLTKIRNANPDVVYLPDYYGTVALIARQMRAQGINTPIVGPDGWDGLTGLDNVGDEVMNGYYSNHYAVDSTEPAVQKFVSSFRTKYNKDPNAFAALGYDCIYMLRDAAAKAGATDATSLRDAMENTDGDYVTGSIKFDAKHNPVKSAVMLEMARDANGKLTTVYSATVNP